MKIGSLKEKATIDCPRCRRPNPFDLIYCADQDCIAVLHPGRISCGACRAAIPVNARFCPQCGHATGYVMQSERLNDGGFLSGKK